jgi:hypothetical protein
MTHVESICYTRVYAYVRAIMSQHQEVIETVDALWTAIDPLAKFGNLDAISDADIVEFQSKPIQAKIEEMEQLHTEIIHSDRPAIYVESFAPAIVNAIKELNNLKRRPILSKNAFHGISKDMHDSIDKFLTVESQFKALALMIL